MSINMKRSRIFGLAAVALLSAAPVMAQKTMDDMQYLISFIIIHNFRTRT